ncbi:hypothetical protein CMMCAS06_13800 [Clavibacter michiganensis subsp. michiganensis]|nr:hypothetical protein CMMCAS06_13800 [Clavibacter michiganensis subsp. michiganensis]
MAELGAADAVLGARSTEAAAQTCGRRCGDASSTSTVSARQNDFLESSVMRARTRSPGIASETKITRPSCLATETPPCAMFVTSTSTSRPTCSPIPQP